MTRWLALFAVLVLAGALCHPAFGQFQTGSILVRTLDQQQATVPGATVTIAGSLLASPTVGVTDNSGLYRIPALPAGEYSITAEHSGFEKLVRPGVIVSVGQTTVLDLVLRIGGVSETVTVEASTPVVDTTSSNVSVNVNQQLLQETPTGHDVWSLMEAKMPSLTVSRPDVGGAEGGSQAGFSARGTTSGQNTYFLNGINTTSPTSLGSTSFYFDYDSFEEIQVSEGSHDLSVSAPGVFVNLATKLGGNQFHGKASYAWEGSEFQTTNIDTNLSNFGFQKNAGTTNYLSDASAQFGGPIIKDKLFFFVSYRDWRVSNIVAAFASNANVFAKDILGDMTYQLNSKNRITFFGAHQWFLQPNYGATGTLTPVSTQIENNQYSLYQAWWNSILSNTAFLEVRASYQTLYFPLLQKGGTEESLSDASTGNLLLNAANTTISTRHRLQITSTFQKYIARALGGRHEVRFGIDYQLSPVVTTSSTPGDVDLAFFSQPVPTASTVTLLNTPLVSKEAENLFAFYLQDSYKIGRLTITGGVRWERLNGYLPAQSSPPSPNFPSATRSFSEAGSVIDLKNPAPRIGFAYDLLGNGKTLLKAAAGRYLYAISTDTVNMVNPNFTSSATYKWNLPTSACASISCLQFAPGELGTLLSMSGGLITSFNPNIRRPYTDEVLVGVDREILPSLKLSVVATYRHEKDQWGTIDVGVPFSAYQLVNETDLGPTGVPGTAYGVIPVWNENAAYLGKDKYVITNSSGLDQQYHGIDIAASKRFSNGWQLLAGYTYARAIANGTSVTSPNNLIDSHGSVATYDRPNTFKTTGTYMLPHGVILSGNFHVQSGLPLERTETFKLNQGNVTVNVTPPGIVRLDPLVGIDGRVGKVFKMKERYTLEATLDCFNLLNANTVWNARTLTGRLNVYPGGILTGALLNQQEYLAPLSNLEPRLVRTGLSFRF